MYSLNVRLTFPLEGEKFGQAAALVVSAKQKEGGRVAGLEGEEKEDHLKINSIVGKDNLTI
jgi:hypothetical protein